MSLSFANIAAIGGKSGMEDNTSAKAPNARRFAISREYLQEWSVGSEQEVAPGPVVLLEWLAKSVLSKPTVGP